MTHTHLGTLLAVARGHLAQIQQTLPLQTTLVTQPSPSKMWINQENRQVLCMYTGHCLDIDSWSSDDAS